MANTNAPFGLRPIGHADGSAPTMGLQRYIINSSDTNTYFTGDIVGLSSAVPGGAIAPYSGSSLAIIPLGVFQGCEFYNPSVGRVVWSSYFPGNLGTSSSPCNAYIITDPQMLYKVQGSSAVMGSSFIGYNVNMLSGQSSQGNTLSGISAMTVASTQGTLAGSSQPLRVIDMSSNYDPPGVNGADNTTGYGVIIVAPNNWSTKSLTAVST